MPCGYIGSIRAKPGCRDDVVAILLSGTAGLRAAIGRTMPKLTGDFSSQETDILGGAGL